MAYVYRHIRLDKNEPFYVGIGSDNKGMYSRANNCGFSRNRYWHNIVNKTDYEVEIMLDGIEWGAALLKEVEFIKLYGRKQFGGTLVNLTDGGEGNVGYITSEEAKKKQSLKKIGKPPHNKGKPMPAHQLANLVAINKGRQAWNKGIARNPESTEKQRQKMIGKMVGEKHHQFGKKMPDYVKAKLSEANKNRPPWNKGVKMTKEQIEKSGLLAGKNNKQVIKYNKDMEVVGEYESASLAALLHGVTKGFMCMSCKSNKVQICKGFYWAYKNM